MADRGIPIRACLAAFATAFSTANAGAQVVADEACPLYAVDIEAFATCDGDRVARPEHLVLAPALLTESAVPLSKRSSSGLYMDSSHAHRLKHDFPARVVLIDVRTGLEAGLTGQAAGVDMHVPFQHMAMPLRWDDDLGGWAMTENASFAKEVDERLLRLGVDRDTPLLLLCRAGDRSARAADELAALGYTQTISVVDGFEGDIGPDGRRLVNGWKNAGLPWTARPSASVVYGAHQRTASLSPGN